MTLYYIDDVQYVEVDDETNKVIQISDKVIGKWKTPKY